MKKLKQQGRIYTIPAGVPFLKTLARALTGGGLYADMPLEDMRVLLPTRRACRSLQAAFLNEQAAGQAMLLPYLQPLGDVDEEELSLSLFGEDIETIEALPAELPSFKRQILLARLIKARPDFHQGFDCALALAQALGRLMDQVYTENLELSALAELVPDEFADHWQITLEFLEILSVAWPKILAEEQAIDGADRRRRLLRMLADFWSETLPDIPVIVAGTTGSLPATARLLSAVLSLPKGMIILPGLDQEMDEESWAALDETHPQYGLKQLLARLEIERDAVEILPDIVSSDIALARQNLAREMMRPAETSKNWADLSYDSSSRALIERACTDLELYECKTQQEEAQVISILLREALEISDQTACLITPDRGLAARVVSACRRWGIEIDDSAGRSLLQMPVGQLFLLSLEALHSGFSPMALLALVQHPFMRMGLEKIDYQRKRTALDIALRGAKPAPGFEGLRRHIEAQDRLSEEHRSEALAFLSLLEEHFEPLSGFCEQSSSFSFSGFLQAHVALCEALAALPDKEGAVVLWAGAAGQEASAFFLNMLQHSSSMMPVNLDEYKGILVLLMRGVIVRPAYGFHPRVQILGQLEARMIDADLVILGGLNEGVWPPDAGADPWMSRPMRRDFGLPGLERGTGLAAHDFVQGFCAPRVVMVRACFSGSAPSVPSRWLQRLGAVMSASGVEMAERLGGGDALEWARRLDYTDEFTPAQRPAPCPPVSVRPRRLSVTKIEHWLRDPYMIYAGSILQLRPLEMLEKPVDAALRGQILHDVLDRFVKAYPDAMPAQSAVVLQGFARDLIQDHPALWRFWWPRFERITQWYIEQERDWRVQALPVKTEIKGEMVISAQGGDFVLSGRADRIDRLDNGQGALIDYKSGGSFSFKRLKAGELPQLPLEGLILAAGGFESVAAMETGSLGYWLMKGGAGASGQVIEVCEGMEALMDDIQENLCALIDRFDQVETPYMSLPRPDQAPRFNDYLHLARALEWGALEQPDSQEQDAA